MAGRDDHAQADADTAPTDAEQPAGLDARARRRWPWRAGVIQRIYQADLPALSACGHAQAGGRQARCVAPSAAAPCRRSACGGKIIAFIEDRQPDLIRRILEHCGLWHVEDAPWREPPPRGPPKPTARVQGAAVRCRMPEVDAGVTYEVDLPAPRSAATRQAGPEYLEHARRESIGEHHPELPWDA